MLTLAQLAAINFPAAVSLTFCGSEDLGIEEFTEAAVLLKVTGIGDDLRAEFRSTAPDGPYEWEAYVYERHLAYGSSADELQIADGTVEL